MEVTEIQAINTSSFSSKQGKLDTCICRRISLEHQYPERVECSSSVASDRLMISRRLQTQGVYPKGHKLQSYMSATLSFALGFL